MAKKRKLLTVAEVVAAFGGTKATAEWAGVGAPAVSNWVDREYIPPGWHYRMTVELARLGFMVDPVLFGMHLEPRSRSSGEKRARVA